MLLMYWYQLILYLRPGLKPKPWNLHVVSFILKYIVTQNRPNPKKEIVYKLYCISIFKGLVSSITIIIL